MEKGLKIALVILVIAVSVVIVFNLPQSTGNATLTPKANYGPINDHTNAYHSCVYLTNNDGWSVTTTQKIRYFNRLTGESVEIADSCYTKTKVREFDCEGDYMRDRPVICPPRMVCVEGSCVYEYTT